MTTQDEVDDFLTHYGVPGMKWGVRRERRRQQKALQDEAWGKTRKERRQKSKSSAAELKEAKAKNEARYAEARKDPTFSREVKLTRKGKGISGKNLEPELTKNGGVLTGHVKGDFRNSKGEKISSDFANAVANEAVRKNDRLDRVKISAITVASAAVGAAFVRSNGARSVDVISVGAGSAAIGASFVSSRLGGRAPVVRLDED